MRYIIYNVICQQIRNKTLLIITGLTLILTFMIITGDGLSINNQKITQFEDLVNVGISLSIFFSSMLSIFLSMNTIPQEFENKRTHLILVRPISRWQYMLALVLGNIGTSLMVFGILSISMILFIIYSGNAQLLGRLLITISILSLNIITLSGVISVASIKLVPALAGLIGLLVYILGVLHNYLATFSSMETNFCLKILTIIIPNIIGVQQQGAAFLHGLPVDWHVILKLVIFIYLLTAGPLFLFKKEV